MFGCDRIWHLTWTCYGTRLPGDARGFVGRVRERRGDDMPAPRLSHNRPRTEFDGDMPGLERAARSLMRELPARLTARVAAELVEQFVETARFRGWRLLAAAVMADHVHLLVGVCGDPDPETLLRDFKAYGSRRLNRTGGRRRWWTDGGSTLKKINRDATLGAARYVRDQEWPLALRIDAEVAAAVTAWEKERELASGCTEG